MLLVKIFFGDLGDREAILSHISRRREDRKDPWLTRRHALAWAQFTVRWAAEAEEAIRASRGS